MLKRQSKALIVTPPPTRAEREQMAAGAADVPTEETRIAVTSLNTLQWGRYEAARRQIAPWLEGRTGKEWKEAVVDAAGDLLLDAGLHWARAYAAVTAVETRASNRMTGEVGEWQPAEWPELESIDAYVDDVPADLASALDELVFDLNPGLFRLGEQDAADAKKNGGIRLA